MKLAIPILVLIFSIHCAAQDIPKAELIDDFERTPCDNFRAHLDGLNNHLTRNPESVAHIIIFGETNNMRANAFYKAMIRAYLNQRKLDPGRVRFLQTSFTDKLRFQIWLVPLGIEPPKVPLKQWSYKMAIDEKPYKFTWLNEYDDICPEVDGVELYADFLKANPRARGNIVIRETTNARINRRSRLVLNELIQKHQIRRKQLRVFYVKEKPDGVDQRVEYWLVP